MDDINDKIPLFSFLLKIKAIPGHICIIPVSDLHPARVSYDPSCDPTADWDIECECEL